MRRFPLFVALAAFILYVCTMGSGLTLDGLPFVSKLAGWDGSPIVGQPFLWLLTLPFRVLPLAWLPIAIKLLSAFLAASILGLLTRTVQLLPWDYSWAKVGGFVSMLPILTAVVVCGFDFSFWQEATSTCGELIDLLLLAALVWLLLEYNLRENPRWLEAAAVVLGVGVAENWMSLFVVPVAIWAMRTRILRRIEQGRRIEWDFILRLITLISVGFLIYAVLPTANGLAPHSPWTLGKAWMASFLQTKSSVAFPYRVWHADRFASLAVVVTFLVPTLPLLIRMRDEDTRNKSGVDRFQIWLYRSLRVGLLLACFWLAFDPTPGARQMLHRLVYHDPLLSFDYLNALGAAFLMGNLLLISQNVIRVQYYRSPSKIPWGRIAGPVAAGGLALVAIGLIVRNAPAIVHLNHCPLEEFGDLAVKSLPPGSGIVLSDYPEKTKVFKVALARYGAKDWLAVDTSTLASVQYRAELEQQRPAGWLTDQTRHELTPLETVRLLVEVARTNRLFYLSPSFGHFFEAFYAEPVGSLYELKRRGKDPFDVPPLADGAIQSNEHFWTGYWDTKLSALSPHESSRWVVKMTGYGLVPASRDQDRLLVDWLSIPLDGWAVALQQQGHLREAQVRLEEALKLNTNNVSSRITLACNTNLQGGVKLGIRDVDKLVSELGTLDRMTNMLDNFGPIDEPTMGFLLGTLLDNHGLLIEAAEQFERAHVLAPGSPAPELALAEIYNRLQMPGRSRPLIKHLREEMRNDTTNSTLDLDLALLESNASLMETNGANARDILEDVVKKHPDDLAVENRVLAAFLVINDFTNALDLVDGRLAKSPDDISSLDAKALILLRSGRTADSLPVLDHVLMLTNEPAARVSRAFAQIALQNFALAKSDLHFLENAGAAPAMVDFGLALVAEHDSDTNSARRYFQLCLSNAPAGAPLSRQASARLAAIQPATPAR